jgi:hypothetical protein
MAGWLSRATEAFRRVPPAPEPFNVGCECGDFVTGDRVSAAQRPSCRNCGRPVFVLPANVYPARRKPTAHTLIEKSASGKMSSTANRDVSAAPTPDMATSKKSRRSKHASPSDKQVSVSSPVPIVSPAAIESNGILLEPRSRVVTPFRLVMAAVILIGGLTVWGTIHRSRVAAAQKIVLAAKEAGMKALGEGDFETAARELGRARDAVDLLGRTDADADSIRRFCREAVAGHKLSGDSLFEIAHDGLIASREGGAAARRFDGLHQGTWVLFDATVSNATVEEQPCRLDMPLIVDDVVFSIEVDSPVVRSASASPAAVEQSSRVIFAAQIDHVVGPTGQDKVAILMLNGKTAFLWSNLETYSALGYRELDVEDRDATRALLDRQAKLTESLK